jgi:PAS domain S-box-containing protein
MAHRCGHGRLEKSRTMPTQLSPGEEQGHDGLASTPAQPERMLGDALSCISDFVYIFGRDGRFLFANQPLLDLWGIPLEAAVGKNFFDLKYPDELAARLQRQVREVFETRKRIVDETPYTSPAGVAAYYEYIFSPVIEADGTMLFVVGTTREISERKRTTAALEESRRRLALATGSARIGIWDWDVSADELVWDAQMYNLYGVREEDFGGALDAWRSGVHPEDRERCEAEHDAALNGVREFHTEFRVRWPDEQVRNIEAHGIVLRAADGAAVRMIGVNWDITERKLIDRRLLQQAELLDLAQDAIMVRDIDGRIEFWNRGAQAIYGWTSDEAVGKLASKLLFTDPEKHDLALKCMIETGEWSGELHQIRKGGTQVIVASRWTLLSDQDGLPQCMLVINSDVTEQKKMETQFLRAQRLESIGTLASGVAHDLNNILSPILLSVPLLRDDLSPETRESILCDLESSAQRGTEIVRQVLTFARGAEGDRVLVQPVHLIKEMSHFAHESFPKSIQISTLYPEEPWSIEADPTQLHQVLMNLCLNARDAMPDGGELEISMENTLVDEPFAATMPGANAGPHVLIEVSDNGIGIPQAIIGRIFDPFFTTKGIGKGTGLGLSTCIGIVKSHGGFINIYSEEGIGTTFQVYLPAAERGAVETPEDTAAVIRPGQGELLLLVDDERSIRNMASAILQKHGYQVVVAADGFEAITIFAARRSEVDAVITDITMPLMDGITLIRTLRNINPSIIVLASTGQNDDKRKRELTDLSVPVCLTKPYSKRNLLTAVANSLDRAGG